MAARLLSLFRDGFSRRDAVLCLVMMLASAGLWHLPTGFESRRPQGLFNAVGTVLAVDDQRVRQYGLVREGEQRLSVRIDGGPLDGRTVEAENTLMGKLELDAFFAPGDRALLNLALADGRITAARAVDHDRLGLEAGLFAAFAVLLMALGFWSGLRALVSFVFSVLMIWKALVPLALKGYAPVPAGFAVAALIVAAIVALVGGLNRRGLVAFAGSFLGLTLALGLALALAPAARLNGAVRPFSETLLYSGFPGLDLAGIFIAGIFIAASGAMVDLSMDLASAMAELARHRPDLGRWDLFASAISIGRAVTGTMTTTLLLAYSGGTLTMLMLFMGQGLPLANILNLTYVSSEIFHTLVGSIALVATAPLTALVGAMAFARRA